MALEDVYGRGLIHARDVARRVTDPAIGAEDLLHMAWLRVGARFDQTRPEHDQFAYLRRAIDHAALDCWRLARKRPRAELTEDVLGPWRVEEEVIAMLDVAALVARAVVDPQARAALALALGYSGQEIATMHCCALPTVRTRVLRFREAHGRLGA